MKKNNVKKFLFRPGMGSFRQAMSEVIELNNKDELVKHIKNKNGWDCSLNHKLEITNETVKIEEYGYLEL